MLCLTFKTSRNSFSTLFSWYICQRSHKAGFTQAAERQARDQNKHNIRSKNCFRFAVKFNSRRENTARTSSRERNKVQNRGRAERGEEAQSAVLCESKDQCVENDSGASTFFVLPEASLSVSGGEKRQRAWHLCVNNSQTHDDALWAHQSGTARAIPARRQRTLDAELCMCSAGATRKSNSIHLCVQQAHKKNKINAARESAQEGKMDGHPENIKPRMWKHNEPPCIWTLPCSARRRRNRISMPQWERETNFFPRDRRSLAKYEKYWIATPPSDVAKGSCLFCCN